MPAASSARALAEALLSLKPEEASILARVRRIGEDLLAASRYVREPNFRVIHHRDLEFLFGAYDERFLGGLVRRALDGRGLTFRLSSRMTRAGGSTTRFRRRDGEVGYEIAVAGRMLFDGFGEADRTITVCGLECPDRLAALQRIFEHELIHLAEHLCWGDSECRAPRFQEIAGRLFLHRAHTHDLITRRERAAQSGIRVGSHAAFVFEGRRLTGRVNRITRRATVLVQDPQGVQYSDGSRYTAYYVPIARLEPVEPPETGD